MKTEYEVRVRVDEEEINMFTIYKIKAINSDDAKRLAIEKFRAELCPCHPQWKLDTYVINNPDDYKNYVEPYLDEIKANL